MKTIIPNAARRKGEGNPIAAGKSTINHHQLGIRIEGIRRTWSYLNRDDELQTELFNKNLRATFQIISLVISKSCCFPKDKNLISVSKKKTVLKLFVCPKNLEVN